MVVFPITSLDKWWSEYEIENSHRWTDFECREAKLAFEAMYVYAKKMEDFIRKTSIFFKAHDDDHITLDDDVVREYLRRKDES